MNWCITFEDDNFPISHNSKYRIAVMTTFIKAK